MTIAEFRANYPFKPYQMAEHNGRTVEVISYPYEEGRQVCVQVRTIPGDPSTLRELPCDELTPR